MSGHDDLTSLAELGVEETDSPSSRVGIPSLEAMLFAVQHVKKKKTIYAADYGKSGFLLSSGRRVEVT